MRNSCGAHCAVLCVSLIWLRNTRSGWFYTLLYIYHCHVPLLSVRCESNSDMYMTFSESCELTAVVKGWLQVLPQCFWYVLCFSISRDIHVPCLGCWTFITFPDCSQWSGIILKVRLWMGKVFGHSCLYGCICNYCWPFPLYCCGQLKNHVHYAGMSTAFKGYERSVALDSPAYLVRRHLQQNCRSCCWCYWLYVSY